MGNSWSQGGTSDDNEIVVRDDEGMESTSADEEERKSQREEEMKRFKEELAAKREARKGALAGLSKQLEELRAERDEEKSRREEAERALDEMKEKGKETLEEDQLQAQLKAEETEGLERQVKALKDVANIGAEMLKIREMQVNELKEKLRLIEETGAEYEREVENIRKLRVLYEEREKATQLGHQMELEREKAKVNVAETRLGLAEDSIKEHKDKIDTLQERLASVEVSLDLSKAENGELKVEVASKCDEINDAKKQLRVVNKLLSQILLGPDIDLDRIARHLQEHHQLITDLTEKGKIDDVASVFMDIANRADYIPEDKAVEQETIATNLGKVWTVLGELLSHHNKPERIDAVKDSCYKSIQTPRGPKEVISVSQTFVRLKDLILEKNSLVKEVGRLRNLNTHLCTRLEEQVERLSLVTSELHKTWAVVNKLKQQHKHLHTNEKILKYELQEKRIMLKELKAELEICKEQWDMARQKNSKTEEDWKELRLEFAERKQQQSTSAESGYEDDDIQDNSTSEDELSEDKWTPNINGAVNVPSHETHEHVEELQDRLSPLADTASVTDEDNNLIVAGEFPPCCENSPSVVSRRQSETDIAETPPDCGLPPETHRSEDDFIIIDNVPEEENSSTEVPQPGCSHSSNAAETSTELQNEPKKRTAEEILAAREERFKRLEAMAQSLFTKMSHTSVRSDVIANQLDKLHEHYGEPSTTSLERTSDERLEEQEEGPSVECDELTHCEEPQQGSDVAQSVPEDEKEESQNR